MSTDSEWKDDDKDEDDDDEDYEYPPIIIDNGTGSIKAGFGVINDDEPSVICESIVGHSKRTDIEYSDIYFGFQAINKENKLALSRPIKQGIVQNWDDMQLLWQHILSDQLKCTDEDIEDSTIIMSETPLNPRAERERAIQQWFETFNVSAYYTQNTAVFELYSHGQTTGMSVGVGFDSSYTVPIYQGYALGHAINKTDIGGRTVENYLAKLLYAQGYKLDSAEIMNKVELIENMKQTHCYVSEDYNTEMKQRETAAWKKTNVMKYHLPDGTDISLGSDRFVCGEIFFQPNLIGGHYSSFKSIVENAYASLLSVNVDVRNDISSMITVNGGGSLLKGFVERFERDLCSIVPASLKIDVKAKSKRQSAVFTGATLLSSLPLFKELCITSEEYEESGPMIVGRKCF